jgi:F0F1-type ATP synthase membrane subunit b/b'
MTEAHWVYLSTATFIGLVYWFARQAVFNVLNSKRQEIKGLLADTQKKHLEAQNLYNEFKQKMDSLDVQKQDILANAQKTADAMLAQAKIDIETLKTSKQAEMQMRIADYERGLYNKMIEKYSDILMESVKDSVQSNTDLNLSDLKHHLNA